MRRDKELVQDRREDVAEEYREHYAFDIAGEISDEGRRDPDDRAVDPFGRVHDRAGDRIRRHEERPEEQTARTQMQQSRGKPFRVGVMKYTRHHRRRAENPDNRAPVRHACKQQLHTPEYNRHSRGLSHTTRD